MDEKQNKKYNPIGDLLEKVPFPIVSASSLDVSEYHMNHYARSIMKNEGCTEDSFIEWIRKEFGKVGNTIGAGGGDYSKSNSVFKNPFSVWSLGLVRTLKYKYIFFPSTVTPPDIISLLERKIIELEKREKTGNIPSESPSNLLYKDIITQDSTFRNIIRDVTLYADKKRPLLITGEIGLGNVSLGKLVHDLSPRADNPFVFVDCSQLIVNDTYDSFFGTKIKENSLIMEKGLIVQAEKGTIYLKEIQALPLHIQEILACTILGWGYNDGNNLFRYPDVRVIAESSLGLEELEFLVTKKIFLKELYDMLYPSHFRNIPLRERRDDIPLLTDFFIGEKLNPGQRIELPSSVRKILYCHNYNENINELKLIVRNMLDLHLHKGMCLKEALEETLESI